MADLVGRQLGHYRLTKLIGVGGFGEVYLGEHIHLETQAAVKVMHARSLLSQEEVNDFRNEGRKIAHLTHPHIVHVLDFGIEGHTPFLVMDYAAHGTLRLRHPRGARLPMQLVLQYVRQIADALQYIHDHRMVHCDVKPENMLVGQNDELLLGDFGIATVAQSFQLVSVRNIAGTIAYMAPEQILEHPCPASDQYALGVVTYEWLTGERPFSGNFFEIIAKHGNAPPVPLRTKVSAISPYVEEVVLKALGKNPQQRFASVKTFADSLDEASRSTTLQPPPTITFPHRLPPISQPPVDVNRINNLTNPPEIQRTPSIMQTSLSREGYTTRIPFSSSPSHNNAAIPPPPPPPIVIGNNVGSNDQKAQSWRHGLITRRRVLLGSASLVGIAAIGGGSLWLARALRIHPYVFPPTFGSTPVLTPVPTPIVTETPVQLKTVIRYQEHKGPIYALAWSQDNSLIASGGGDNQVRIWMAINGKTRLVYKGHKGSVNAIGWSPDHISTNLIATGSADQTVQLWDSSNQKLFFTYSQHQGNIRTLSWSPDGAFIASGDDVGSVHIWNTVTGQNIILVPGSTPVWTVAWSPNGLYVAWGGEDGIVHVWSVRQKRVVFTYEGHLGDNHQIPAAVARIKAIAWSPDSKQIASGSDDHTVHVWNITTEHVLVYPGHGDTVNDVAWLPNGRYIASDGGDHQVRIWNPQTGGTAYIYTEHQNTLHTVAWSPDSLYGASGGDDKIVLVWQLLKPT